MIGNHPSQAAFTYAPRATSRSIIVTRSPDSAAHEWTVTALMHIRSVVGHPRGNGQSVALGGRHGTRHSATQVNGPFLP